MTPSSARIDRLILSCEHASARVPARYRHLFATAGATLASHRGYDAGALELARLLARRLRVPLFAGTATRLLVDLNRSPGHPKLFSKYSRRLDDEERREALKRWHHPHRSRVERAVGRAIAAGRVLHVGVHSFTPRLAGRTRNVDLGVLYDPARALERELCASLARDLRARFPHLRVRRNQPYRGVSDGLPTTLRHRFPARRFLGIEIEISQRLLAPPARWRDLQQGIAEVLGAAIGR